jgi:hypothetical protein
MDAGYKISLSTISEGNKRILEQVNRGKVDSTCENY